MYKKHGYTEVSIVSTDFNGIPGIKLVLLEKYLRLHKMSGNFCKVEHALQQDKGDSKV